MKKQNRLVVGDISWAADIPDWLLDAVRQARLIEGLIELAKPGTLPEEVGDAEVAVYLFTASLRAPLPHDLAEIYFWVGGRVCKAQGLTLADFMETKLKDGLRPDEERELKDLRCQLWRQRGGKIQHPLFDVLRDLRDHPPSPQRTLFGEADNAASENEESCDSAAPCTAQG
jgi:hypothetical protein